MHAERLDRMRQHDLVAADLGAAGRHCFGDIARRDRAVEIACLAGLTDDHESLAVERLADLLGRAARLGVAGFEIGLLALEALLVGLGGTQRFTARQQAVAGIAVLDADGFAHMAELGHALEQDHFHGDFLSG